MKNQDAVKGGYRQRKSGGVTGDGGLMPKIETNNQFQRRNRNSGGSKWSETEAKQKSGKSDNRKTEIVLHIQ